MPFRLAAKLSGWTLSTLLAIGVAGARAEESIHQQLLRSVAWVLVNKDYGTGLATGFLADKDRKLLVTNFHVVDTGHPIYDNADNVFVYFPLYKSGRAVIDRKQYIRFDRPVHGKVLAVDAMRDLAVIELELVIPEAKSLPLAPASPRPDDKVYLIGNPGASELLWAKNSGVVLRVDRQQGTDQETRLQIDTTLMEMKTQEPVLKGYSGGPVVNESGQLVGVTSRSNPAARLAYCIDVGEVRDLLGLIKMHPRDNHLLDPRSAADYQGRGLYYLGRGREESAIVDFGEALRRDPNKASVYLARGVAFSHKAQYARAAADFTKAWRLDGKDPRSCRELAWLLATCPEDGQRDGKRAVELALRACELTAWKEHLCLDTLAAAYAEDRQFRKASEWEAKAVELYRDHEIASFRARLALYQAGKPYRMESHP